MISSAQVYIISNIIGKVESSLVCYVTLHYILMVGYDNTERCQYIKSETASMYSVRASLS